MKRILLYGFVFLLVALTLYSPPLEEKLDYAAPSLLAHTTREMKTAGFWISRHPFPDQIILLSEEIQLLNCEIQNKLKLTKDIPHLPASFSGKELKTALENKLVELAERKLYLKKNKATKSFYKEIKNNLNLDAIPLQIPVQFGFIVHFADQRFLPASEGLYEKPKDIDFDELQNSDLDAGAPVVILHKSRDEKWLYVESEISSGWVEAKNVAAGKLKDLQEFLEKPLFVVVTAPKADIFLDQKLTHYYDYVRMGMRFAIEGWKCKYCFLNQNSPVVLIRFPLRNNDGTLHWKTAYMKAEDVHADYLPYTPRRIIEQAFKLLNEPYGWGGMHGEQDCSRFLQEVFATVGLMLPRDSKDQAKVGRRAAVFDEKTPDATKLGALARQAGGITILPLKGHIMLYLGMLDGRPYAIHATRGYRQRVGLGEIGRITNRVVVSDLSLGEGSRKGSWLKRILKVVVVEK